MAIVFYPSHLIWVIEEAFYRFQQLRPVFLDDEQIVCIIFKDFMSDFLLRFQRIGGENAA
jgi:hypothetical protein